MCALVGALSALWLTACADLPTSAPVRPPTSFLPGRSAGRTRVIGVLITGWHAGLVMRSDELGPLRERLALAAKARYVTVGWGNRRFYRAKDPGAGDALMALFPSASVLLIQALQDASEAVPADGTIEWICADRGELWRLDDYLSDSLQWRSGRLIELGAGPLPGSRFYASGIPYDAFHNCNTWTLAALQFAGLAVKAGGALFAGQVAQRLRVLPMCAVPPSSN